MPNAASIRLCSIRRWQSCHGINSLTKMKINWKDVLLTMFIGALGAIIFAPLLVPIVTPVLKKLPVIGSKY